MDQDGSNSATVAEQAKRFSDFMFSQDVHGIVTNEVADFVEVIRTSFTVEKGEHEKQPSGHSESWY